MMLTAMVLALVGCSGDGKNKGPDLGGGIGATCDLTEDCLPGLVCASDATCRPDGSPGTLGEGASCFSSSSCRNGLVCSADGVCTEDGGPGTGGVGDACGSGADCQLGLSCIDGQCYGFDIPLWFPPACPDKAPKSEPFVGLFTVPRGTPLAAFYELPFPNDVRRDPAGGGINMAGHPSPGVQIPEIGDVVGTVIDAVAAGSGFGNNQTLYLRFSHTPDWNSLGTIGPLLEGNGIELVDITPEAEEYGEDLGLAYRADSARGAYICENWIAISPSEGRPYRSGHTYAALIANDLVRNSDGQQVDASPDMKLVLGLSRPTDGALGAAWDAFAPLRAYLDDVGIETGRIANATVFTIQDAERPTEGLREAVQGADMPQVADLHLCTDNSAPFGDEEDPSRACDGIADAFHEIQGRVSLPHFQQGTPPFKEPRDGGSIAYDETGTARVQSTQAVTFSLTVPNAQMPAEGWPLVLYFHGTGGNFRSPILGGTADVLSEITLPDASVVRFAVLTIDGVQHADRRHAENWKNSWIALDPDAYSPEKLFYNPINVVAARDNVLQGAADAFALARLATDLSWDAGTSPTGDAIHFDPAQLFLLGHSQGATVGALFAAWEPDLKGAVLSGAGGLLVESLLNKTQPFDIPTAIRVGLSDPDISREHPILNLAQCASERADAVNHGDEIQHAPPEGHVPRHVFQVTGVGDTYTPLETQHALARAMRVDQISNGNEAFDGVSEITPPVSGNRGGTTAVVEIYAPQGGNDGHFVLFDIAHASDDMAHFLGTAVRDGVPTVP